MKVSKKLLEKLIIEELGQQIEEGSLEEIFGFGQKRPLNDPAFIKPLGNVEALLGDKIINTDSPIGDEYGFLHHDAHTKLAKKGLQNLMQIFTELDKPLADLVTAVKSLKGEEGEKIKARFLDNDYGTITRLQPVVVFIKQHAEELKKFSNLSQLNNAAHKGGIQLPGFLSLIVGEAGKVGMKEAALEESLNRINKLAGIKNK